MVPQKPRCLAIATMGELHVCVKAQHAIEQGGMLTGS